MVKPFYPKEILFNISNYCKDILEMWEELKSKAQKNVEVIANDEIQEVL